MSLIAVPEPLTLLFLAPGLLGLAAMRRRSKSSPLSENATSLAFFGPPEG
jgi:hypothetical protein